MKLSMYQDDVGDWRWRLRARNGKIQAEGGEGYKTEAACRKALAQVAEGLKDAHDMFKT